MIPDIYFARPVTVRPDQAVDNDALLARFRQTFHGAAHEWEAIEQGVRYAVFGNTASTVGVIALDYRRQNSAVADGDKIAIASAAAGFSVAGAAAVRESGAAA